MTTFGWTLFIYPGKQKIYFKVLSSVKRQRSRVRNSPCEQKEAEYICGYVKRLLKNIKNSVKEEKINLFTVHFVSEPVVTWPCYTLALFFVKYFLYFEKQQFTYVRCLTEVKRVSV